jgi:hypothetical protein
MQHTPPSKGLERRSGQERRKKQRRVVDIPPAVYGKEERRSGKDRRGGTERRGSAAPNNTANVTEEAP